jgi:Fic family protein
MPRRVTGKYLSTTVGGETVKAFVPLSLPPARPKLDFDGDALTRAEQAIGRLAVAGAMVPSLEWFIYAFVRKEAVLTSQIEGTQATLMDLLNFEAETDSSPSADVEEVCNYIDAVAYAREELRKPRGLPLSIRLLNEAHRRLMQGVRGSTKNPGVVRTSQNWIGGARPGLARFVPAPPNELPALLSDLEKYIHADDKMPPLVRAGLVHVQFETIHPYLDGNGRLGRLLISLLLEEWGILREPLLYLSLYLKRNQSEYYDRLSAVRHEGDWEGWTTFFLEGVAATAEESVNTIGTLFKIVTRGRAKVLAHPLMSVAAARLFELLPNHPLVTTRAVMRLLGTTKPTAGRAIDALVKVGVLVETSGKRRDRTYAYREYLEHLGDDAPTKHVQGN